MKIARLIDLISRFSNSIHRLWEVCNLSVIGSRRLGQSRRSLKMSFSRMRSGAYVFLSLCCCVLLGSVALAQFRAGIQGTVTDTSGAVVPGVAITVANQEAGISQKAATDAGGFYAVTNLPPGRYTVTASLAGFKTKIIADVEVSAEAAQGVNLTLEPGEV